METYVLCVYLTVVLLTMMCPRPGFSGAVKPLDPKIDWNSFSNSHSQDKDLKHPKPMENDISSSPFIYESISLPMLNATSIDYRYMPFVGNGHLATTVLSDWIFVNGVYNGELGWSHRARIPSTNAIDVKFQDANDQNDAATSYLLNVKEGQWTTRLTHSEVVVEVKIYAHQYYHHLLVTSVTAVRQGGSTREFVLKVTNNRGKDSEDIDFGSKAECDGVNVPGLDCKYITGVIKKSEQQDSIRTRVHVFFTSIPDTLTLPASTDSHTWLFVTSIDIDVDKARQAYVMLKDVTPANLNQSHIDAWLANWDDGMVLVEGDLEISKVLYGSQFYVKSSLPAPDTHQSKNQFYGLSPGGLGKGAYAMDYQGHVFWDMETWMYPTMVLLQPSLAKDMLSYRINGIEEARARAALHGHQGSRFPWESAFTGVEVTPDLCVPCRENQQHITGDIAFAARQYVSATRDMEWLLNERGCEFIIDMAKFWVTRAESDPDTGRYHIRGVMPPDEYHEEIDDSVYTNVGASLSIHLANYTACLCDHEIPEDWYDVATKLCLLYDEERNYHPEFEGYFPEDESLNNVSGKPMKIVKQADVVLLGFPFHYKYSNQETRRNDLNIYREVTDSYGPAMTWGMFCIGYKEIGDDRQQEEMFYESFRPYVRDPFKVWTEARSGIGATNFVTGMGGFLQTVVFGYGGFRLYLESLAMNATLPPGTTSLKITDLNYMGSRLTFEFTSVDMIIEVLEISSAFPLEMELFDDDEVVILQAGQTYTRDRQPGQFYTTTPSNCPLPLDSIIPETSAATHLNHVHSSLCQGFFLLILLLIG